MTVAVVGFSMSTKSNLKESCSITVGGVACCERVPSPEPPRSWNASLQSLSSVASPSLAGPVPTISCGTVAEERAVASRAAALEAAAQTNACVGQDYSSKLVKEK